MSPPLMHFSQTQMFSAPLTEILTSSQETSPSLNVLLLSLNSMSSLSATQTLLIATGLPTSTWYSFSCSSCVQPEHPTGTFTSPPFSRCYHGSSHIIGPTIAGEIYNIVSKLIIALLLLFQYWFFLDPPCMLVSQNYLSLVINRARKLSKVMRW